MQSLGIPRSHGGKESCSLLPDAVNFSLDCKLVEARKGQAQKEPDSAVKGHKSIPKSALDLVRSSRYGSRVSDAPMCCHRLPRPNRANFFGRVVTNRENKIHFR